MPALQLTSLWVFKKKLTINQLISQRFLDLLWKSYVALSVLYINCRILIGVCIRRRKVRLCRFLEYLFSIVNRYVCKYINRIFTRTSGSNVNVKKYLPFNQTKNKYNNNEVTKKETVK